MNVLILGSGGREHALAWKIAQSPLVEKLFIAPGNAGTAQVGENIALDLANHEELVRACRERDIGLVVVGPDDLLAEGIVDVLQKERIPIFGPTKRASEIEWSKAYAKTLMHEAGIKTARSKTTTNFEEALTYVKSQSFPIVIKASGLALGKGVAIASTLEEAELALKEALLDGKFGEAGKEVVIEEFLVGREISIHALCAGTEAILFPSAMDHKRIGEGDTGPNTGGMGTIAPLPFVTQTILEQIRDEIVLPTLRALKNADRPFNGLLFPGIMLTNEGPKVLEFNARFGDPETQSYMRLLKSDIVPALMAVASHSLKGVELTWNEGSVACVIMASGGYPNAYEKGKEIHGIERAELGGAVVFHAGTKKVEGQFSTCGGRVLGVTALGNDLPEALATSYRAVSHISFDGAMYRRDIGTKALFG